MQLIDIWKSDFSLKTLHMWYQTGWQEEQKTKNTMTESRDQSSDRKHAFSECVHVCIIAMTTNEIMTANGYTVQTHTSYLLPCGLQRGHSALNSDLKNKCDFPSVCARPRLTNWSWDEIYSTNKYLQIASRAFGNIYFLYIWHLTI